MAQADDAKSSKIATDKLGERDICMLTEAVADIDLLLSNAIKADVVVPVERLHILLEAKRSIRSGTIAKELEAKFWVEFLALGKQFQPITVSSLRACIGNSESSEKSSAGHLLRRYQILSFLVLIPLILIQIYTIIGSTHVDEIERLTKERKSSLVKIDSLNDEITDSDRKRFNSNVRQINAEDRKLDDVSLKLFTRHKLLSEWDKPFCSWIVFWNTDFCNSEDKVIVKLSNYTAGDWQEEREIQTAKISLEPLSKYILPLLYGFLGACVYIIRTVSREIRNYTYKLDSSIHYQARLSLGALAGLAIGWFVTTGSSSSVFQSITPITLAFLAGYGVELLFSAMDKIIVAFSATPKAPVQK